MTESQRLRSCINLLQLRDNARNMRARNIYDRQLRKMADRFPTKKVARQSDLRKNSIEFYHRLDVNV